MTWAQPVEDSETNGPRSFGKAVTRLGQAQEERQSFLQESRYGCSRMTGPCVQTHCCSFLPETSYRGQQPHALPDKHTELQDGGGGGENTPLIPSFTVRASVCLPCLYSFATPGLQDSRLVGSSWMARPLSTDAGVSAQTFKNNLNFF